MPSIRDLGQELIEVLRYYFGGVWKAVNEKQIFLWAQAIAFKVLITIVPVFILATGVLGIVLQREAPFVQIAAVIREFLPPGLSDQIISFLEQVQASGGVITALGAVGLIFSAVTIFSTLRVVVSNIFQEEWHLRRPVVIGYMLDIRLAVQVGLLFILTIGLSVAAQGADLGFLTRIGLDYGWIEEGWRRSIGLLGLLIPYLLTTAMFFQLFYFIPKPRPPKRSALLGAVVTGLLWEVAKYSFAVYATGLGRPERFGGGDEGFPLGNTFALIVLFVFWIYYSGIVLIIGGIIAVLHEKRRRLRKGTASPGTPDDDGGIIEEGIPPENDISEMIDGEGRTHGESRDVTVR